MDSKPAQNKEKYRFFEEKYTADIGFEAFGDSVEALMVAAAEAAMTVMVPDLGKIRPEQKRTIQVLAESLDMLLFDFIQELIFYKDAEQLLLVVREVRVEKKNGRYRLSAEAFGEELDPRRHEPAVDVKAVTFHELEVSQTDSGWRAVVVLDI
jgi:SHS2 domain-containing protein